jgi:Flp pilus assembly protein TadD
MVRRAMIYGAAALAMACATPALAKDRNGYRAIAAGDLPKAERRLQAERRIFPDKPELLLNLAYVYARTGRTSEARALYTRALDVPAVELDMPSGAELTSHQLAERGLMLLDSPAMAAR